MSSMQGLFEMVTCVFLPCEPSSSFPLTMFSFALFSFLLHFFPFLMSTSYLCLLTLIFSVYACPNPDLWILSLNDFITHVVLGF